MGTLAHPCMLPTHLTIQLASRYSMHLFRISKTFTHRSAGRRLMDDAGLAAATAKPKPAAATAAIRSAAATAAAGSAAATAGGGGCSSGGGRMAVLLLPGSEYVLRVELDVAQVG